MTEKPVTSVRLGPEVRAKLLQIAEIEGLTLTDLLIRGAYMVMAAPPTVTVTWGDFDIRYGPAPVQPGPVWRVGKKLGRTLYRDEEFVGAVDSPELAAEIVAAMNRRAA